MYSLKVKASFHSYSDVHNNNKKNTLAQQITNLSSIFNCFIIHKSKSSWAATLQDSTYYKQNNDDVNENKISSTTVLNHTFRNAYSLNHYHTYMYSHLSHSLWVTEDNWILARVLNKSQLAKFAGYFMSTYRLLFLEITNKKAKV